jgi:hypothetical protein
MLLIAIYFADSSVLKMEELYTTANHRTTLRHIQDNNMFHKHRCGNLEVQYSCVCVWGGGGGACSAGRYSDVYADLSTVNPFQEFVASAEMVM